jgi:hypothetical protein
MEISKPESSGEDNLAARGVKEHFFNQIVGCVLSWFLLLSIGHSRRSSPTTSPVFPVFHGP